MTCVRNIIVLVTLYNLLTEDKFLHDLLTENNTCNSVMKSAILGLYRLFTETVLKVTLKGSILDGESTEWATNRLQQVGL